MAKARSAVALLLFVTLSCCAADSSNHVHPSPSAAVPATLRGVGVNYFDAIARAINRPEDQSYRQGLRTLAKYEVPFVRVMFGAYWPSELNLYRNNRKQYFAALDDFVHAAEEEGIGIVANLGWNHGTIPDLVGEPVSAWGKPDSKTNAFFRQYVGDVVNRYRHSPAIWMWEFTNEIALYEDLPNASDWRRPIDPKKGTPSSRSNADDLTARDATVAMAEFAKTVRSFDSRTPISSGNALPRPFAFHNSRERSWKADDESQFCEMLGRDNPQSYDVISIHIYPSNSKGYFGAPDRDYNTILRAVRNCARRLGKPVFAGEFGVSESEGSESPDGARRTLQELYSALIANDIVFSAVWVFDFRFQEGTYNFSDSNSRAYQLDQVRAMNRQLRGRGR